MPPDYGTVRGGGVLIRMVQPCPGKVVRVRKPRRTIIVPPLEAALGRARHPRQECVLHPSRVAFPTHLQPVRHVTFSRPMTAGRLNRWRLLQLLEHVEGIRIPDAVEDVDITAIRTDSNLVERGDLFVAIRGTTSDGHDYLEDVARRGAAAVVVEAVPDTPLSVPAFPVGDSRLALAQIASVWHGEPASELQLIGISGTVGKTSVLSILQAIMGEAGIPLGAVGSLGVSLDGTMLEETGYTAPDPLLLHEKLAELRDAGAGRVAMEVTSHALDQHRVAGLRYALGIFTNLLPLEHQEYHASFEEYVQTKVRFYDHLLADAPLVFNADDLAVAALVADLPLSRIPCGTGEAAAARIEAIDFSDGTAGFELSITEPLRTLDGGTVPGLRLPLRMRLLGRSNIYNAALAATGALVLGAAPESIRRALETFPPPRRRVEMIHHGRFTILDDTVGHPDSVNALFEAVEALRPARLHVAFAVRGTRGPEINHHTAEALTVWLTRFPSGSLVVTRSEDEADARNRVTDEENEAFLTPIREADIPFEERNSLREAVESVLAMAEEGDLVLLLGAQGMDAGAAIARDWLERNSVA